MFNRQVLRGSIIFIIGFVSGSIIFHSLFFEMYGANKGFVNVKADVQHYQKNQVIELHMPNKEEHIPNKEEHIPNKEEPTPNKVEHAANMVEHTLNKVKTMGPITINNPTLKENITSYNEETRGRVSNIEEKYPSTKNVKHLIVDEGTKRNDKVDKKEIMQERYALDARIEYENSDGYLDMAHHYNIDDYGTPIDEYIYSVDKMKGMTPTQRVNIFKERGIKTVLYYHSAYGAKTYGFNYAEYDKQGQLPYIMKGCRRHDCFCTDKRDFIPLEDFDAILFYSRAITKSDIPQVRKAHQRYILWEMEPAAYLLGFSPSIWGSFFNWTHTYRRESDFWEPWGLMNRVKPFPKSIHKLINESKTNTKLADKKTKGVAWFVSNCNALSGRDSYAKELQKYIPVDIYGRCGPFKCDRSVSDKCWDDVERDYYFYFSAENSLCKDYITEKFFNALKKNIIPITFGGGQDTNDYYFTPQRSHINVFDYKSPEELAKYLKYLQANKDEYVSYFWWKPYYSIWLGRWKKAHCEICDKLHANEPVKVYKDFQDWWVHQGKCRPRYR